LHAAVVTRRFAAAIRRRGSGEQSVAAGVHAGPADAAKAVGEHHRCGVRNEAEKVSHGLSKQSKHHHAGDAPAISPVADDRA